MKILFCSSEVTPFAKTGGMADVCGTLPLVLEKMGAEVAIALPRYRCVDEDKFGIKKLNKGLSVATIGKNIQVFFIENEKFFDREGLYGDKLGDYPDNLERFVYYCKKTLESLKQINHKVDIVHCHDWQAALIPAYLKYLYRNDPFYKETKSIMTIHNLAYQGLFFEEEFAKVGLDGSLNSLEGFEFYGDFSLLKGGLVFSDVVTTVSKQYAREIQTADYGCGLEGVLRKKGVTGILNGVDYDYWNPQTDSFIVKKYSAEDISGKYENKKDLQQRMGFPLREDIPLVGYVGRLSSQKGLDLLAATINRIAQLDIQMVFLGTGDAKYEEMLRTIAHRHRKNVALYLLFDEPMAHRVYAASDLFIMPSIYEPCGLSQLISLRYATIPIVFKTGGLADTIIPFDAATGKGNGFVFDKYRPENLFEAVKKALEQYQDKNAFGRLIQNGLACDFSWEESAKEYMALYEKCLQSA